MANFTVHVLPCLVFSRFVILLVETSRMFQKALLYPGTMCSYHNSKAAIYDKLRLVQINQDSVYFKAWQGVRGNWVSNFEASLNLSWITACRVVFKSLILCQCFTSSPPLFGWVTFCSGQNLFLRF